MNFRKPLHILSGDDYNIIVNCSIHVQNRFAVIGGFVFCIFILCFVSSYLTFTMLFQNYFVGIPVSIFFSWMITNIYLLLLYTLTKNVLPHVKNKAASYFSITIRLIFICFIAIVVAKPIEVLLYKNQLTNDISNFKQEQIKKYVDLTSEYFENATQQIEVLIKNQEKLYGNTSTVHIDEYKLLLQKKKNQEIELILDMKNLINYSNYYIRSILILNSNYPLCWLFTFLIVVIFLIPAYLKNFLAEQSNYYLYKREKEVTFIEREYASFKSQYNIIFQTKHGVNYIFIECFEDAPFNTIPKKDAREFATEDDLINELYA